MGKPIWTYEGILFAPVLARKAYNYQRAIIHTWSCAQGENPRTVAV